MKLAILITLGCLALSAQTPTKIDFTQKLVGSDGKLLTNGPIVLTLGEVAMTALETLTDSDRQATGAEKFKWDELARKVYGKKDVVLSVPDINLIIERIGKVYTPAVIGAAWPLLDPTLRPATTAPPKAK
jgi:hypothetical protein